MRHANSEESSSQSFILPPKNQVATGLRDMDNWAMLEDVKSNDAFPDPEAGTVAILDSTAGSHELVMVLPWPLHARALYFPPPTTLQKVALSWHEAPSPNGVTIIFTNVENYSKTKISEEQTGGGEVFAGAVRLLQQIVRSELLQHNGYEVEGEEVNFVLAFRSPVEAVSFAAAVQVSLVNAGWSSEVLDTLWGCEYGSGPGRVAFRGMRLAIGMCTGDAIRTHPCERTGRMEYFGPLL